MNEVTVEQSPGKRDQWTVKLDGRATGTIRRVSAMAYQYRPAGSREKGEVFPSLSACVASLTA